MQAFRDIKRRARRDLHQRMRVPALYIATPGATPKAVHVRVHTKFEDSGDFSERDIGNALRHDKAPRLIFMIDELVAQGAYPLARNAIVSVEPGEAYRIGATEPPDDITITADVSPVPAAQTTGLPVP